ncbi:MAG: hypothetical protein E7505_01815 [Ruminococcus sp.]|nr:hypothetical protein [Ruminococcus sp.]
MKKYIVLLCSALLCLFFGVLLKEKGIVFFSIIFPFYYYALYKYIAYSNSVNSKNIIRNNKILELFYLFCVQIITTVTFGGCVDYFWGLSQKYENVFFGVIIFLGVLFSINFIKNLFLLSKKYNKR